MGQEIRRASIPLQVPQSALFQGGPIILVFTSCPHGTHTMDMDIAFYMLFVVVVLYASAIVWDKKIVFSYADCANKSTIADESEDDEMLTKSRWVLMASKMNAAVVYYIKRDARCRRGRSPSRSSRSISSGRGSPSGSERSSRIRSSFPVRNGREDKSIREIHKLRSWKTFNGFEQLSFQSTWME